MSVLGMTIVWRMRDFADIELRKQNENERLNYDDEQSKRHQQNRNEHIRNRKQRPGRSEMRECVHHFLIREHVSEETNAKRERPDHVTDEFDQKDQRSYPPDGSGEMLQMPEYSIFLNPDVVVIDK